MKSDIYILLSFILLVFLFFRYRSVLVSFLDSQINEIRHSLFEAEAEKNNSQRLLDNLDSKLIEIEKQKEQKINQLIENFDKKFQEESSRLDIDFENQKIYIKENYDVIYMKLKNKAYLRLIENQIDLVKKDFYNKDQSLLQEHVLNILIKKGL
ncbi:MAG: hypothetical protein ISN64_02840 [Rickettsia sp.]|nr:hypothetical protein [Rickettsia sp.]